MPGTGTATAGMGEALRVVGLPQSRSAVRGDLARRVGDLWHHAFAAQPLPPLWLILGSGVLALAVVASSRVWPVARIVVTIVHEGGHALVALATGRRLAGIRLYRDTGGVTLSRGRPDGLGIAFTAAAGYPAPSLLGLGAAALLAVGHLTGMLLLSLALLAGIVIAVRNAYGMLAVLTTAGGVAAVCLFASAVVQAGFGYTMTWFLLLGGVRPVIELQRERRRDRTRRTDADQLARLTPVPGGAWVMIFGVFAVTALAISARWLVR
ncbi:MAG TPA: M50 family metallopeptidase [Streptosporangiaceae bacterium]|nr:M50 family metallopeptidase [Streptosporangiaceae bacterium]